MHEAAGASLDRPVTRGAASDLEVEFEARLADSAALGFRVAYGVLRHREDAEDVAQEALARAYRKLDTLRERERFRAWLVRICWRLARDRRRAAQRRERRQQMVVGAVREPTAEDMAAANEFRGRLWQAIDQLPEKLRVVLVLAGIEGYDMREVARTAQPACGHREVPLVPGAPTTGGEVAMSCERHRPALMEVALGAPGPPALAMHLAECQACRATPRQGAAAPKSPRRRGRGSLHLQPSVDFLSRVRQRVIEPPPARRWWLMSWLVPAAIGLLLVSRLLVHKPTTPAPARPQAAATEPRPFPPAHRVPAPSSPRSTPPAAMRMAHAERAAAPMPAVLIPAAEREALRRYMRGLQARRVDSTLLRMVGDEATGLRSIDMPPIDVAPIRIALIGVQPL